MRESLDEVGLEKAREFVRKDIKLGDDGYQPNICSYQLHYLEPDKVVSKPGDICHAGFRYEGNGGNHLMIGAAIAVQNPDECSNSFYKYLLSPVKSPYRKILSEVETVSSKGRIKGFIIKSGNVNQETAINLAIASRQPYEFRKKQPISFWYDMVEKGVDETVALYLYLVFDTQFQKRSLLVGHSAFHCNISKFSLRNLLQADTLKNPQNLLKTKRDLSCNHIWIGLDNPFYSYYETEHKIVNTDWSKVVKESCPDLIEQTPSALQKWKKENMK
jgi:hypothetical protein